MALAKWKCVNVGKCSKADGKTQFERSTDDHQPTCDECGKPLRRVGAEFPDESDEWKGKGKGWDIRKLVIAGALLFAVLAIIVFALFHRKPDNDHKDDSNHVPPIVRKVLVPIRAANTNLTLELVSTQVVSSVRVKVNSGAEQSLSIRDSAAITLTLDAVTTRETLREVTTRINDNPSQVHRFAAIPIPDTVRRKVLVPIRAANTNLTLELVSTQVVSSVRVKVNSGAEQSLPIRDSAAITLTLDAVTTRETLREVTTRINDNPPQVHRFAAIPIPDTVRRKVLVPIRAANTNLTLELVSTQVVSSVRVKVNSGVEQSLPIRDSAAITLTLDAVTTRETLREVTTRINDNPPQVHRFAAIPIPVIVHRKVLVPIRAANTNVTLELPTDQEVSSVKVRLNSGDEKSYENRNAAATTVTLDLITILEDLYEVTTQINDSPPAVHRIATPDQNLRWIRAFDTCVVAAGRIGYVQGLRQGSRIKDDPDVLESLQYWTNQYVADLRLLSTLEQNQAGSEAYGRLTDLYAGREQSQLLTAMFPVIGHHVIELRTTGAVPNNFVGEIRQAYESLPGTPKEPPKPNKSFLRKLNFFNRSHNSSTKSTN